MRWRDLAPSFAGRIDRRDFFYGLLSVWFAPSLIATLAAWVAVNVFSVSIPDVDPLYDSVSMTAQLVAIAWLPGLYVRRFRDLRAPVALALVPVTIALVHAWGRANEANGGPEHAYMDAPEPWFSLYFLLTLATAALTLWAVLGKPREREAAELAQVADRG
jgi:uncharacterized membrane protein YhaH (DUF805 family)